MKRLAGLLLMAVSLAGCFAAAPVPEENFYRLRVSEATRSSAQAHLLDGVMIVSELRTDGVHRERAMLYSTDPEHIVLQQYHYHIWIDPPPRLVQDYLVAFLRANRAAPVVARPDVGMASDYLVSGTLTRFEQLAGERVQVAVGVELQLQSSGSLQPLLLQDYVEMVEAATPDPGAAVVAYEQALARIAERFLADVRGALAQTRGRAGRQSAP